MVMLRPGAFTVVFGEVRRFGAQRGVQRLASRTRHFYECAAILVEVMAPHVYVRGGRECYRGCYRARVGGVCLAGGCLGTSADLVGQRDIILKHAADQVRALPPERTCCLAWTVPYNLDEGVHVRNRRVTLARAWKLVGRAVNPFRIVYTYTCPISRDIISPAPGNQLHYIIHASIPLELPMWDTAHTLHHFLK